MCKGLTLWKKLIEINQSIWSQIVWSIYREENKNENKHAPIPNCRYGVPYVTPVALLYSKVLMLFLLFRAYSHLLFKLSITRFRNSAITFVSWPQTAFYVKTHNIILKMYCSARKINLLKKIGAICREPKWCSFLPLYTCACVCICTQVCARIYFD